MGLEWQTIIESFNLTIVANWINFGILVVVLSWLLFRPAKEFIQEKREKIKSRIDNAQEKEETARQLKKEREEKLKEAKRRRNEIIEEAERRAEEIIQEGREEAEEEAERIVEQARKEARQEKEEAFKELEEEYVDIALTGAEKVLQRDIKREDHAKFLDSLFDELKEKELNTG